MNPLNAGGRRPGTGHSGVLEQGFEGGHGHERTSEGQGRELHATNGHDDEWDPFAIFTHPPENESLSQRSKRIKEERHAKAVSEAIDEDLNRARHARRRKTVQLLLLGESLPILAHRRD